MIGTITRILAKAGWKSMNGPLADERRRLAGAVAPAAYASYDPRLMAGAGWYGYRISFKGGDRSMLEAARYLLREQYVVREMYDQYTDNVYSLGVVLRQRVRLYGIGGGSQPQPEPDALNFYMPNGGTITLTKTGSPTVVELEYSIDGGATWQVWEEAGNVRSITLAAGQKMYVRNTSETSTIFSKDTNNYYYFIITGACYCGGPLESLLCKDKGNAIETEYCFYRLFRSNLYNQGIKTAPTITFNSITKYRVLYQCFSSLASLVKVTILATSITGNQALSSWLSGVSLTGDFYCPAELTIPVNSTSGIPAGWTRHDI